MQFTILFVKGAKMSQSKLLIEVAKFFFFLFFTKQKILIEAKASLIAPQNNEKL